MRIRHQLDSIFSEVPGEIPPGVYPTTVTVEITADGNMVLHYRILISERQDK